MAGLDPKALAKDMIAAAGTILKKKSAEVKQYAKEEFEKLAKAFKDIEVQVLAGSMTLEQAKLQRDMVVNASKSVLLAVEGMGKLAAEQAINAALDVAKAPVNKALGFPLL